MGRERQPPNSIALDTLRVLLGLLAAHDFWPDRIAREVDGGIAVYFFRGADRTRLVLDNDGSVVVNDMREGQRTVRTVASLSVWFETAGPFLRRPRM